MSVTRIHHHHVQLPISIEIAKSNVRSIGVGGKRHALCHSDDYLFHTAGNVIKYGAGANPVSPLTVTEIGANAAPAGTVTVRDVGSDAVTGARTPPRERGCCCGRR